MLPLPRPRDWPPAHTQDIANVFYEKVKQTLPSVVRSTSGGLDRCRHLSPIQHGWMNSWTSVQTIFTLFTKSPDNIYIHIIYIYLHLPIYIIYTIFLRVSVTALQIAIPSIACQGSSWKIPRAVLYMEAAMGLGGSCLGFRQKLPQE